MPELELELPGERLGLLVLTELNDRAVDAGTEREPPLGATLLEGEETLAARTLTLSA